MSSALISRNPDLKRLRDEGYDVAVHEGYLVLRDVPYVDGQRQVRTGTLVSALTLAGDQTVRPACHTVHFAGEQPCHADGSPIQQIFHQVGPATLGGVHVDRSFSNKPAEGFADHYEKFTSYANILSGPAQALDPALTPRTYPPTPNEDDASPFQYVDTAASRANITGLARKFAGLRVAIVGLGGTGSYVLDLIAKTPLREIHLFDGDRFLQHNAFRAPGAHTLEALRAAGTKAGYLARVYSVLHRHVIAHEVAIDETNVSTLRQFDYVFLCVDSGSARRVVSRELAAAGIPLIDVGMGLTVTDDKLTGVLRVTTSTAALPGAISGGGFAPLEDAPDGVYSQNIEIADLNALNATLAVLKWKKLVGFYHDDRREHHSTFAVSTGLHTREQFP